MLTYEKILNRDLSLAVNEGGMHFGKESAVHKTLRKIAGKLDELGIPYAIAGGMALFFHGYRRFTEDVDILVTPDGLKRIHEGLEGRGYLPPFKGSRQLRDTESGVRIEFLVTGQYPGDGKPKAVAFPAPDQVSVEIEGIRLVRLATLIELKLASGTTPGRRKDLGDVQELVKALPLPAEFARELNPSVQELFRELWAEVQDLPPEP
jgi:hypothetical protein